MDDSTAIPRRLPVVDVLRGVALVAMIVYHFSWDLAYHRLVDWDVAGDPVWRDFARTIAASFLAISGLSLVLARRAGADAGRYAFRVAKIGAAAAAVTAVTYAMFPDSFVFFGILHMIATGAILSAPLLGAPAIVPALLAAAVSWIAATVTHPLFDAPLLWWVGLSTTTPVSNDYVPVFPWLAPMLVGVAVGRLVATGRIRLPSATPTAAPLRALAAAGRWSLVVYLVHQPLLFGLVSVAAGVLPTSPAVERARFVGECRAECVRWDDRPGYCERFCGCVASSLDGTSYFSVRGGDPELGTLVATAATTCRTAEDDAGAEAPAE
ncbi:DUF1624 domain-containing protein [Oharaeibacter diazotrophicus]|uniref:Putative membrane protein n=1 Tax=Oharaeibacter diazotrophicus TaxID=1920512 RepID=A0A4R6R7P0_9HYPH|nr:heparan-alpha-glucosaminide N-acetyltransferase [Oharaeibacter diazotrophicus]TDP82011.1 putative membrane protein [Oharaeibacter diazotrophicus]BBE73643.1 hypothetical protein OHA_1_03257 [Pleomorphomonas sp. SM30]GLS75432.1 membrane protein [Oharaeibacter diazotrophicus]